MSDLESVRKQVGRLHILWGVGAGGGGVMAGESLSLDVTDTAATGRWTPATLTPVLHLL